MSKVSFQAAKENAARAAFTFTALVSILAVALICVFLFANGIPGMAKIGAWDFLSREPYIKELAHLPRMAENAIRMVTGALDAYVRKDVVLAQEVMGMDDAIDALFVTVKDELIDLIRHDAAAGSQAIDLLMIAKYYERIGDHAQNIAEWVEYALTGRHKGVFLT